MTSKREILKRMMNVVMMMVVIMLVVDGVWADAVRLHDRAVAQLEDVRLVEIAKLDGESAAKYAELIVATFSPKQTEMSISLVEIRSFLERQDVNWAKVSLRGYAVCRVQLRGDVAFDNESQGLLGMSILDDPAVPRVAANPDQPIDFRTSLTVRDRIREWLEVYTDTDGDDLRIGFNERDSAWLNESAWRDRVVIEPVNSMRLGTVIVEVHRFRGEGKFDSKRLTLNVSRRALAVVAVRVIRSGQTIVPGDVIIEEVYLDESDRNVMTQRNQVIGQRAGRSMRKGVVVYEDSIRPPVLIKRGETVSVRSRTGDLVIKLICRANEDGAMGDMIELRNETARQTFMAKVVGPREAELNNQRVGGGGGAGAQVAQRD